MNSTQDERVIHRARIDKAGNKVLEVVRCIDSGTVKGRQRPVQRGTELDDPRHQDGCRHKEQRSLCPDASIQKCHRQIDLVCHHHEHHCRGESKKNRSGKAAHVHVSGYSENPADFCGNHLLKNHVCDALVFVTRTKNVDDASTDADHAKELGNVSEQTSSFQVENKHATAIQNCCEREEHVQICEGGPESPRCIRLSDTDNTASLVQQALDVEFDGHRLEGEVGLTLDEDVKEDIVGIQDETCYNERSKEQAILAYDWNLPDSGDCKLSSLNGKLTRPLYELLPRLFAL